MNRRQIRDLVSFRLNFNDGQVDQGFTNSRLNTLIDLAYNHEVIVAKNEGDSAWFKQVMDVTWEADSNTLELPGVLNQATLLTAFQVINPGESTEYLGSRVNIRGNFIGGYSPNNGYEVGTTVDQTTISWKDRKTLQWGNGGAPTSDIVLRITYMGVAETLQTDDAEPQLIPVEFHELIALSAAIEAREVADSEAPRAWYQKRDSQRLDFLKHMSTARPAGSNQMYDSSLPYPYL